MTKYLFYLTKKEEDEIKEFFDRVEYPQALREFQHMIEQRIRRRALE